jgi:hypothetical protein
MPVAGSDDDFADFYAARFDAALRTAYALCGDWVEAPALPLTEGQLAELGLAMAG